MLKQSNVSTEKNPFEQLEALLRSGDTLGEGFEFEPFVLRSVGMEIDRLRFSHGGMVNVDIRQTTNQPKGLYDPAPYDGWRRPMPFSRDILVDLWTVHPAITLGIQHEDGFRHYARNSGWLFTPNGNMEFNMVDFNSADHGPITEETKRNQLELILGEFTVSKDIPEPFYLDIPILQSATSP